MIRGAVAVSVRSRSASFTRTDGSVMIRIPHLVVVFLISFTLAGCEVVWDVFRAGLWVGIVLISLIVFAIWAIIRAIRR